MYKRIGHARIMLICDICGEESVPSTKDVIKYKGLLGWIAVNKWQRLTVSDDEKLACPNCPIS